MSREAMKQEPVAWIDRHELSVISDDFTPSVSKDRLSEYDVPLYTAPPRREWVGLIRGVRVEDDKVIVTVKGGNENARLLCGELLREKNT